MEKLVYSEWRVVSQWYIYVPVYSYTRYFINTAGELRTA
jgi:hypothetical protein